jgi:hypothetical protein
MKKLRTFFAMALISTAFVACDKDDDDVSNPDNRVMGASSALEYEVVTDRPAVFIPGASFTWTSGYAWIDELKFEAKAENGDHVMYKSKADRKIDLFAPSSALGVLAIPPGTYDKIKFRLELEPREPEAAILLNGLLLENGVQIPVVFAVNKEVDLYVHAKDVLVMEGDDYLAVLALQLAQLTNGITAGMLYDADVINGQIVISNTYNRDLYNIMLDNVDGFVKADCQKKKKK